MANIAYLSLGSNLGDRIGNLRTAIKRLESAGKLLAISSLYETEPLEFTHQPWFLNAAIALDTSLTPRQLLIRIAEIESEMRRQRNIPKGPRTIDLDILLFGDAVVDEPDLKIPHPGMHLRRFVLEPLAEIAPSASHPILGRTACELLHQLHDTSVVRRSPESIGF